MDRKSFFKGYGRFLFGLAVAFVCIAIFVRQLDIRAVISAFGDFHWIIAVPGLVALAVAYVLRIQRWAVLLRLAGAPTTFVNCSAPFLASVALNNVLPFRLGDIVRALVFPASLGISRTTAASSIIVERVIDLTSLLVCMAVGLFVAESDAASNQYLGIVAAVSVIVGGTLLCILFMSGSLGRLLQRVAASASGDEPSLRSFAARALGVLGKVITNLHIMSRPRGLVAIFALSLVSWICEAGLYYFIFLGVGVHVTIFVALFVMSAATLSTLIPSTPGYVGTLHLAVFTATTLMGVPSAQAAVYAILIHLWLWTPITLAGLGALWGSPQLLTKLRALNERKAA